MKAHELLDSPEKWTQGTIARNAHDDPCSEDSDDAVSWCLSGAIWRIYGPLGLATSNLNDVFAAIHVKVPNIPDWNDQPERTFEEVRTLLLELDL